MLPDWKGGCPIIRALPIHCVRSANRQSWGQAPPRLVGKTLDVPEKVSSNSQLFPRGPRFMAGAKYRSWVHAVVIQGQGPQPFLLRMPGRSPRPEPPRFFAPPLNTGSSELRPSGPESFGDAWKLPSVLAFTMHDNYPYRACDNELRATSQHPLFCTRAHVSQGTLSAISATHRRNDDPVQPCGTAALAGILRPEVAKIP